MCRILKVRRQSWVVWSITPLAISTHLYSAAMLVAMLVQIPNDGEFRPVVIRPPFNAIAYMLTRESNGMADLVLFHGAEGLERVEDVITVGSGFSRITLTALGKRLSRAISQLELRVRALAERKAAVLEGIVVETRQLNDATALQIADLKSAVAGDQTALERFGALQRSYPTAVARLSAEAQRTAENLNGLTELADILRGMI